MLIWLEHTDCCFGQIVFYGMIALFKHCIDNDNTTIGQQAVFADDENIRLLRIDRCLII